MSGDARDHLEELLNLVVRAPVGFLASLIEEYPKAVKRGKTQTDVGLAALKSVVRSSDLTEHSAETFRDSATFLRVVAARLDQLADSIDEGSETATQEPVVGYDQMTAREVKALIGEIDEAQCRRILEYEKLNKKRKTVLDAAEAALQ